MISVLLSFVVSQINPPLVAYDWKSVPVGGGGFISGIITSPTQKNLLYCRTDIGGCYRWDQAKGEWVQLLDWVTRPDWNLYGGESMAIDPTDSKRLYIAAGTYTNQWGSNGAILISKDQGKSFDRVNLPFKFGGNMPGRSVGERLMVDPLHPSSIWFGTRTAGLWKSIDHGQHWAKSETFPVKGTDKVANFSDDGGVGWEEFVPKVDKGYSMFVGVVGEGHGIYETPDQGATWSRVMGQPDLLPIQAKVTSHHELVIVFSDGQGPNGMTTGQVWKYDPPSHQWTNITPEVPSGKNTFGYASVTLDAQHPETWMVSTMDRWNQHDTVFRTVNGGKSWVSIGPMAEMDSSYSPFLQLNHSKTDFGHWLGSVRIDPFNSNRAWYGTGATLWETNDLTNADQGLPTHWKPCTQGLEETAVTDLVSPPSGAPIVSALGDIQGFVHDDLTKPSPLGAWKNPQLNTTNSLACAYASPSTFVRVGTGGGSNHGGLSTDGGHTWLAFPDDPVPGRQGGSVAISTNGATIYWSPDRSDVYRSEDAGTIWTKSVGGAHGTLVADTVDPTLVYDQLGSGQLLASHDSGMTFAPVWKFPQGVKAKPVPVPGSKGWICVPSAGALWVSKDSGKSFEALVSSVQGFDHVSFGKAAPGSDLPTIFALKEGENSGAYRSTDWGKTWLKINDAAHSYGTMDVVEGDPKVFGRVFLGTNGRGLFVGTPAKS